MEKWACDFCGADMPARVLRVDIPAKHYEDVIEDINVERKEQGEKPITAEEFGKGEGFVSLAVCLGDEDSDDSLECCSSCMQKLLVKAG